MRPGRSYHRGAGMHDPNGSAILRQYELPERRAPAPSKASLSVHSQQLGGVAAEDRDLVVVGARRGGEHMVDRMPLPRNGMVGAEHALARADLGNEMAQRLSRDHQGIEMELIEIFGRLLLEMDVRVAVLRRHEAGVIVARRVGWQIAAAMRRDDLEIGKLVERSFEDQVLERKRGLERIADRVGEPAI